MIDIGEITAAKRYFLNVLDSHVIDECGEQLASWLNDYGCWLKIDGELTTDLSECFSKRKLSPEDKLKVKLLLNKIRETLKPEPESKNHVNQFVLNTAALFDLNELDQAVLALLLRINKFKYAEELVDALGENSKSHRYRHHNMNIEKAGVYAKLCGCDKDNFRACLSPKSNLYNCGLVGVESDGDISTYDKMHVAMDNEDCCASPEALRSALLGKPLESSLLSDDFRHIEVQTAIIKKILAGALGCQAPAINIFLHGGPGTGKTEYAKTLASGCGLEIYPAGEADENGDEPSRQDRTKNLKMLQALLKSNPLACILVDEAEDIFPPADPFSIMMGIGSRKGNYSKVYINRMLESNKVPVIWTSNNTNGIDPAIMRRMTYALEFEKLTGETKERFVIAECKKQGLVADESELRALAREYDAAPALIASAVRSAQLAGGGLDTVRNVLDNIGKVIGIKQVAIKLPEHYYPELVNADIPLVQLADRIAATGKLNFSLCLYGAPGTGKSAYARYLAEKLGMEVLHIRASDLLSKYVGEAEQNIARAFSQAKREKKLLVFDEADSFLQSRKNAQRSWEVTQVNEMLTWMESHELPFICTTNLMDNLDEAALRRFTFKVKYDYLNYDQKMLAWKLFYATEAPMELNAVENITPADFAVAKKKAEFIGGDVDAAAMLYLLKQETDMKQVNSARIGF